MGIDDKNTKRSSGVREQDNSEGLHHPVLGPWIVTIKQWQPRVVKGSDNRRKETELNVEPTHPNSATHMPGAPQTWMSPPNSPLDLFGWEKPTKIVHHVSPEKEIMVQESWQNRSSQGNHPIWFRISFSTSSGCGTACWIDWA